ncbi:hypothetical protein P4403_27910, partial [Bacillus thuringiensis]
HKNILSIPSLNEIHVTLTHETGVCSNGTATAIPQSLIPLINIHKLLKKNAIIFTDIWLFSKFITPFSRERKR